MKRIVTVGLLVALFLISRGILHENRTKESARIGSPDGNVVTVPREF
jgi:hypothetical protein